MWLPKSVTFWRPCQDYTQREKDRVYNSLLNKKCQYYQNEVRVFTVICLSKTIISILNLETIINWLEILLLKQPDILLKFTSQSVDIEFMLGSLQTFGCEFILSKNMFFETLMERNLSLNFPSTCCSIETITSS